MLVLTLLSAQAQKLMIPMDLGQTNHLKAYGIVYWILTRDQPVDWLLNYRGGSFVTDYVEEIASECRIRGVFFETIDGATTASIYAEVQSEKTNMDVVRLEKAPRIAVYAPPGFRPWDDAVTLVMEYAEVKYDKLWDEEVIKGKLSEYDWLHLHHEDFTGQFGKFYANSAGESWYIQQVALLENTARKLGYAKVSELKRAVVNKIRDFVSQGGFMFAMCSATDTYDIALAADGVDICAEIFDGDPMDMQANEKLDYSRCFAFDKFKLVMNPLQYEYSTIDVDATMILQTESSDYFTLFDFSAKYDPVPTMLTQCHVNVIKGFLGQTTAFHKEQIKKSVLVLAEREGTDQVRYIHGNVGRGTFTWYGGHDPEDYRHAVGDPPTDLKLHPTSPGYRLILNNILFPAAKKKKQKT
ncbi:MAG: asparagine synthetase B [Candidatus Kapabacteria bacterium]|nr:asparagine synthetase B [Candidatus Kapabacteria bacterium]